MKGIAAMNSSEAMERLSKEELRILQNKKLHAFINHYLYPFSPHYRALFDKHKINPKKIKTVDDLKNIPFSQKNDFVDRENPEKFKDFILHPDPQRIRSSWPLSKLISLKCASIFKGQDYIKNRLADEFRPVFITYTTGTTLTPLPYVYTKYDINNLSISGLRMLHVFDIKESDYLLNLFPFAPHLAFWQVALGGLSCGALILSTGGGKVMGTEGNLAALLKMKASVIVGVPSYIYHILRVAQEKGYKLDFVKKVVLGASRVSQIFKIRLVELLESMGAKDVSVFGTYGFTEARCAWGECPTKNNVSSGYHLYPDKEIFEVIDPATGELKEEGEDGELVYTSIDSRGSSVLRYRTGDFVKGGILYEPCPHCHRSVPRISSHITRISDTKFVQVSKIKGSLVNLNNFSATLSEIKDIREWQLELSKKDDDPFEVDLLQVYVSVDDKVDKAELAKTIKEKLLMATEVCPNEVKFISLKEMIERLELETANKDKRIVDRRPKT